jgi:hypothetical protein
LRGLIQVTATKGHKTITAEVFGTTECTETLFARLMNRNKIVHAERPKWKLLDVKLNREIEMEKHTSSSFEFRDYQRTIITDGVDAIKLKGFLYLAMQVRTGKTLTSLGIAQKLKVDNVLFLTKKNAISTIESDYELLNPNFDITIINYESIHKLPTTKWDLIVCDESHSMGAFPKPSKRSKQVKELIAKDSPYVIFMSGTPTPESFSQMYHQVYGIRSNPFSKYKNFYRFCDDYVKVTERKINGFNKKDYSDGKQSIIEAMMPYTISYSQKEAGFKSNIVEHKLYVKMSDLTYSIADKLKKNLVVEGKDEVILGDTSVKLMMKLHQIYSGTVKFESGNSKILDLSKAKYIHDSFADVKTGIFYKFSEELNALKEVYGDNLCTELDEFNSTDKTIALQIQAGREGISLKKAVALVYYNIDFSATSYWQSRDRMTTSERTESDVYWIFAEGGIEDKIYKAVCDKKNYTTHNFKRDLI